MITIAALYHFTHFDEPAVLQAQLQEKCNCLGIKGSVLLAHEGINGTIAGSRFGIDQILQHLKSLPGCKELQHKESSALYSPFPRMKVKIKKEIVSMGQPNVDPKTAVGNYVEPKDWNEFISTPNIALIDTRNDYEIGIGTFEGAMNPKTKSFREFPKWWKKNKEQLQGRRIAMFCTGGIRCEKSTNYLLGQGVKEVYHLKGGILKYLEEVPETSSKWNGKCFVFDARVSVGHGLKEGPHKLCYACRRPILPEDQYRQEYEHGVACHQCIDETSEFDKKRFRERQKQIQLARERGESHMTGYDNR